MGRFFNGIIFLLLGAAVSAAFLLYRGGATAVAAVPSFNAESGYEIVQPDRSGRDIYMLDKKTGRVWQRDCMGQKGGFGCDGVLFWNEMYVENITPRDSGPAQAYDRIRQIRSEASAVASESSGESAGASVNTDMGVVTTTSSGDSGTRMTGNGSWQPRETRRR